MSGQLFSGFYMLHIEQIEPKERHEVLRLQRLDAMGNLVETLPFNPVAQGPLLLDVNNSFDASAELVYWCEDDDPQLVASALENAPSSGWAVNDITRQEVLSVPIGTRLRRALSPGSRYVGILTNNLPTTLRAISSLEHGPSTMQAGGIVQVQMA